MPSTPCAFLDHPKPLALAHRGGGDPAAENTMTAFADAVGLGYRYIETDVRATRDGVPVTFHDDDLSRVSGDEGSISKMTWQQLGSVRVAGQFEIPRLEDVLTTWPDIRLNIDVKNGRAIQPLAKAIESCNAQNRVCIASFSERRTAGVRSLLGNQLCYSVGPLNSARVWCWSRLRAKPSSRHARRDIGATIQLPGDAMGHSLVDRRLVTYCHELGLSLHVWTVNTEGEMARLIDLGVDGIITDRTALLKKVLESRGQWPSPA